MTEEQINKYAEKIFEQYIGEGAYGVDYEKRHIIEDLVAMVNSDLVKQMIFKGQLEVLNSLLDSKTSAELILNIMTTKQEIEDKLREYE